MTKSAIQHSEFLMTKSEINHITKSQVYNNITIQQKNRPEYTDLKIRPEFLSFGGFDVSQIQKITKSELQNLNTQTTDLDTIT